MTAIRPRRLFLVHDGDGSVLLYRASELVAAAAATTTAAAIRVLSSQGRDVRELGLQARPMKGGAL